MGDDKKLNNENNKTLTPNQQNSRGLSQTTLGSIGISVPKNHEISVFEEISFCISKIAFSNNGRYLVASDPHGQFFAVCDTGTGRIIRTFYNTKFLAINHNGKYILSAGNDKKTNAILWETATGKRVRTFKWHKRRITSAVFSFDGRLVLTGSRDETAILWETDTGRRIKEFKGHNYWVTSVDISNDNGFIIVGTGFTKTAVLWDTINNKKIREFKNNEYNVAYVRFNANGTLVLTSSLIARSKATLWETATGKEIKKWEFKDSIFTIDFSSDGNYLLTKKDDNCILINVITGEKVREFFHKGLFSVAFSFDGKYVATGGDCKGTDHKAIIWDTNAGKKIWVFKKQTCHGPITAISSNNLFFLTDEFGGKVYLWDKTKGKKFRSFVHGSNFCKGYFIPNGKNIVTVGRDKKAIIWDSVTGGKINVFEDTGDYSDLDFSPDGRLIIAIISQIYNPKSDRKAIILDIDTGETIWTSVDLTSYVQSVAFSPDGSLFLAGDHRFGTDMYKIILWDTKSKKILRTFKGHKNYIYSVAISPDNKFVLSGSWDRMAILWDIDTGNKIKTIEKHEDQISSVAFSSDGLFFITVGDNRVILWETATCKEIRCFKHHKKVYNAFFSHDDRLLVTTSADNRSNFWDQTNGEKLVSLHNLKKGFLWTTPPDEVAKSGWFWTDCPELISVIKCNEDGSNPIPLEDNSEDRNIYISLYNRQDMVMDRLNNWEKYIRKINKYIGRYEHQILENHLRNKQEFYLTEGKNYPVK